MERGLFPQPPGSHAPVCWWLPRLPAELLLQCLQLSLLLLQQLVLMPGLLLGLLQPMSEALGEGRVEERESEDEERGQRPQLGNDLTNIPVRLQAMFDHPWVEGTGNCDAWLCPWVSLEPPCLLLLRDGNYRAPGPGRLSKKEDERKLKNYLG